MKKRIRGPAAMTVGHLVNSHSYNGEFQQNCWLLRPFRIIIIIFLSMALLIVMNCFVNSAAFASDIDSGARLIKAEYQGKELSKNSKKPTVLLWAGEDILIDLIGNRACATLDDANIEFFLDSRLNPTGGGYKAFDHNGRSGWLINNPKHMFVGDIVFEVYWNIRCIVETEDGGAILALIPNSDTPKYYITFSESHSGNEVPLSQAPAPSLDPVPAAAGFGVNGLFHTVKLTESRLIVEVKEGFIFGISSMLLKDITENEEYLLAIAFDNPDCTGLNTNRIVFDNLSLKRENIYELTVSAKAVYYESETYPHSTKYNREYRTGLIMEGAISFSDTQEGDWAFPYVMELAEKRVMSGYEDGTFRPNSPVTRSEFVKIMALALQIPLPTNAIPSYVDIDPDDWNFAYVEATKGFLPVYQQEGNYYFNGNEPAVREDMAVMLVKALGLENLEVDLAELEFMIHDYEAISPDLQKYVLIAYKYNLLNGYPDGTFGAQRAITRAETAALLYNVCKSDVMEKVIYE